MARVAFDEEGSMLAAGGTKGAMLALERQARDEGVEVPESLSLRA